MIRLAHISDVHAMVHVYNEAIEDEVHANCDAAQRGTDKFSALYFSGDPRYIVLVKESGDGAVIGWGALKKFSARPNDDSIAEVAVYIGRRQRSVGLGISMLKALVLHAKKARFQSLIAIILGENTQSIRGTRFCGFEERVRIPLIAKLYGHHEDIVWMQKTLT